MNKHSFCFQCRIMSSSKLLILDMAQSQYLFNIIAYSDSFSIPMATKPENDKLSTWLNFNCPSFGGFDTQFQFLASLKSILDERKATIVAQWISSKLYSSDVQTSDRLVQRINIFCFLLAS